MLSTQRYKAYSTPARRPSMRSLLTCAEPPIACRLRHPFSTWWVAMVAPFSIGTQQSFAESGTLSPGSKQASVVTTRKGDAQAAGNPRDSLRLNQS